MLILGPQLRSTISWPIMMCELFTLKLCVRPTFLLFNKLLIKPTVIVGQTYCTQTFHPFPFWFEELKQKPF